MSKRVRSESLNELFRAILCLKNEDECYRFFEDACTMNELLSISGRLEVARLLHEGKTYNEIAEQTGASTATISRVNRALLYGSDGYGLVLERLEKSESGPEAK